MDILVDDIGNVFLGDGFDGQSKLIGKSFGGVPGIAGFELCRMGDVLLEFFLGQVTAVGLSQGKTVFINVIGIGTFDLLDAVAATGDKSNHIDPEDILHTGTADGAARLFGKSIETVDLGSGSRPRIDSFLAGSDDVDTSRDAFFDGRIDIVDEGEEGDDSDIGIARI